VCLSDDMHYMSCNTHSEPKVMRNLSRRITEKSIGKKKTTNHTGQNALLLDREEIDMRCIAFFKSILWGIC
jgi:hypothetical protein